MKDNLQQFKEQQINNYLSTVDISEIDVQQMKRDLRVLIGEEPAIRLNYEREQVINEDGSKGKSIETIKSFTVIFTIEKEGYNMPFPVEETYIIH